MSITGGGHHGRTTYFGIHLEGQHDLRSAIPSGSDILGHDTNFLSGGNASFDATCEAEVANLEIAVGIEQEVGRFKVPMDNVGAMDGLERSEGLVDKVLKESE